MPTMTFSLRRLNFSCSNARLFSAKRRKISFSALNVLTSVNPLRQSASAAVKSLLRSDTHFSAVWSLLPARSEAHSGSSVTPMATEVSTGEYQSIMPSAPKNVTTLVMSESCCER